ncbi:hypothetical protein [Nocardia jinanensis]|uniref:Uncharacterized protein n=1 Tax=Nocardia jinanensis TaxID=382504 RepID=A0A917R7S3_9NOCA|nr:hypothetical protein [Nocardia jinanensis]GGK93761.1 hypothetical protein GCM10011588_05370 [Nocardia jinanensis]
MSPVTGGPTGRGCERRLGWPEAGVTEFMAAPYRTPAEQDRTVELLAELARRTPHAA